MLVLIPGQVVSTVLVSPVNRFWDVFFRDHIPAMRRVLDLTIGEFSLADIHWAPSVHALCLYNNESLVDSLPGVKAWWGHMKVRKSMSKENYVAYTVLPSLDEIRSNTLRSVSINV